MRCGRKRWITLVPSLCLPHVIIILISLASVLMDTFQTLFSFVFFSFSINRNSEKSCSCLQKETFSNTFIILKDNPAATIIIRLAYSKTDVFLTFFTRRFSAQTKIAFLSNSKKRRKSVEGIQKHFQTVFLSILDRHFGLAILST